MYGYILKLYLSQMIPCGSEAKNVSIKGVMSSISQLLHRRDLALIPRII